MTFQYRIDIFFHSFITRRIDYNMNLAQIWTHSLVRPSLISTRNRSHVMVIDGRHASDATQRTVYTVSIM